MGHDLRPRSRPACRGGVGRRGLFPRRARRDARVRVADRAPGEGGTGPGRAGERLPGHPAARGARRPLHRSPHAEQSGDAALLRAGAQLLRHSFRRFLYADLHSLFLGKEPDGTRVPRPLPQAPAWFGCFDYVQLNEEELAQLGDDPLALAAGALAQGCNAVCVTLGARGAAYFTGNPTRSALVPVDGGAVLEGDPTGCGDVFGATVVAA